VGNVLRDYLIHILPISRRARSDRLQPPGIGFDPNSPANSWHGVDGVRGAQLPLVELLAGAEIATRFRAPHLRPAAACAAKGEPVNRCAVEVISLSCRDVTTQDCAPSGAGMLLSFSGNRLLAFGPWPVQSGQILAWAGTSADHAAGRHHA
jgi:hypothetical protein